MKLLRNIFFVLLCLFWGVNSYAQNTLSKGVGAWHSLPFADVRLLSCTTGTLNRNLLVGGLQIKIHPGWVLKKPNLRPLSEYGILDYPIRPDPLDTTQYTGTILLPIIYNATAQSNQPFGVQGNLIGCWDKQCLDLPIRVAISLDASESDYTAYCAYIMDEISQTPKLDLSIGKGYYIDDHTAVLRFHIPDIHQAFLQNQNGFHFQILQTQFFKNDVQFVVSYPENWPNDTIQDWILITNQGVFRVPIHLMQEPLPPILQSRPWGLFLFMGILLFICSPFFALWGIVFPKTAKQLRHQCVQALAVSVLLTILICLVMKYVPYYSCEKWTPYILVIMGITLIFPPRFVWWAGLLFIIWPKPYLKEMVDNFSLGYLIPWLILWQIIPFALLYRNAEFWGQKARWSLKKDFFLHNLFFLLPTIIMLIYGGYYMHINILYQKTLDLKSPALVCEKEDCHTWHEEKVPVQFIDAQSSLGKTLLDLYQGYKNLLIFDDEGTQTILTDTDPKSFKRYLVGLKNYRAGYRPVDPPVHSGDAPHDP